MARRRDFSGKVVVVTGAGGGLGAAYSRRFAQAGAKLALLDVNAANVSAVAAELAGRGVDCRALPCDVSDEATCQAAINAVIEHFGGIDVLINNAGITHRSAFADTESVVFHKVMAVNFFGALYCTKAALPSLRRRQGLIIAISSIAGFAPLLGRSGYAAAKHACQGLFSSLRAELAGSGVDVMIVCPGFTATGIGTAALDGDGSVTRHPQSTVGKVASPDNVAAAVLAAASRSQRLLVLTAVGKTTLVLNKIFPALYERIMTRSLRHELERPS
ncbi:MAG: SDR family oxidoreductase [Deltaproteobacteria bacterium]|nr:SDR family oxidoreductase [Deltaproteobacteria bacterium]